MTGTHTQNPIISRITLALMEDTGWYLANYSMAEPMSWGKGLGCDFVMKSCKEWITIKSSRYFMLLISMLLLRIVISCLEEPRYTHSAIKSNVILYKRNAQMIVRQLPFAILFFMKLSCLNYIR